MLLSADSQTEQDSDRMTSCDPVVTIDPNEPPQQELPNSRKLYKIPEEDSNKHPTCPPEKDANCGKELYPYTLETVTELIRNIDIQSLPVITNEVAIQLLKIQSRYLDDHPYLCTSRFRHALHQLPDDHHKILEQLCFQLHCILLNSSNELCTSERKRLFFNRFLKTVFDEAELRHSEHEFSCCRKHPDSHDSGACSIASTSLESKLQAVFARLVTDYRAIFAIEGACERIGDDESHHLDHEHRKHRHEEDDDECPEEIKFMKVACEELSLECASSSSNGNGEGAKSTDSSERSAAAGDHPSSSKRSHQQHKGSENIIHRYYSSVLRGIKKGIHHHHHSTEDPNKHLRKFHHHSHSHHGHGSSKSSPSSSKPVPAPLPIPATPSSPVAAAAAPAAEQPFNFRPFFAARSTDGGDPGMGTVERWTPGAVGGGSSAKINSESATSFDKISNGSSFYQNQSNQAGGSERSKQRGRKERRDSYSEQQDKKHTKCSNKDEKKVDDKGEKDVTKSVPIKVSATIEEGGSGAEGGDYLISCSPLSNATSVTTEGDDDAGSSTDEEADLQNESKRAVLQHVLQEQRNEDNTLKNDLQNDTESGTFGFVDSDFVPTASSYATSSSTAAAAEQRKLRKERSDSLKENNAQTSIPTAIFATSVIASAAIPIISKSPEPSCSEDNGVRFLPSDTASENSLLSCSPATTVTTESSVTTTTASDFVDEDDDSSGGDKKQDRMVVPTAALAPEEESVSRFYPETSGEEALLDEVKKSPLNCERYRHLSSSSWTSTGSGGSEDSSSSVSSFMINQGPVSWMPHLLREAHSRPSNSSNGAGAPASSAPPADEDFMARHILHSRRHMDPSHMARANSDPDSPKKAKMKHLQRQYSNVKRKLEEMEREQEEVRGFSLSRAEKLKSKPMQKLMTEMTRLKRQIRNCRDTNFGQAVDDDTTTMMQQMGSDAAAASYGQPASPMSTTSSSPGSGDDDGAAAEVLPWKRKSPTNNNTKPARDLESMRNSVSDMHQRLKVQRQMAGRPYELDNMDQEQLLQEKYDIQHVLLEYEHMFGHPVSEEERLLTKCIYDRYRSVKRQFRKSNSLRSKESLELATIPEDLEVPMTMATPPHRINIEITSTLDSQSKDSKKLADGIQQSLRHTMDMPCFDTESTLHKLEANLHSMSRYELLQVQRKTREEKKLYRRAVKEKEDRMLAETGMRKLPKGQRIDDSTYNMYKHCKNKLKLIEALLSKPGGGASI